ncbi:MAG TPA: phosphoglycerate kinase [Mycobacteriales bacterium]|nr:phosphoglycerate kinase [Mycobacteriales bacterium]
MRTLDGLGDLAGRTVLVRCDLNVPLEDGPGGAKTITDDGRIRASLPLLQQLTGRGAKVVVMAHLGRPQGVHDPAYSLAPVGTRLEELLGLPVRVAGDVVGESAAEAVRAQESDRLVLLENVRFEKAETSKDDAERRAFAQQLAHYADVYVDDAFGAVHRKHASVFDVAQLLPSAAGPLVAREVEVLRRLTETPERPYAVVLGGSKVSDKLAVIENLLPTVDALLVGGGMCFTFLAAQGHDVGSSLLEHDQVDTCRRLLESGKIVLPVDVVAATAFSADAESSVVAAEAIPADRMGLDIGPESVRRFTEALDGARTVFWNGPMGVFEMAPYAAGTRGVAEAVAARTADGALTVVGGGDSAAAVRALGVGEDRFTHISTGGGASLEYLEGKALPGLTVLED